MNRLLVHSGGVSKLLKLRGPERLSDPFDMLLTAEHHGPLVRLILYYNTFIHVFFSVTALKHIDGRKYHVR